MEEEEESLKIWNKEWKGSNWRKSLATLECYPEWPALPFPLSSDLSTVLFIPSKLFFSFFQGSKRYLSALSVTIFIPRPVLLRSLHWSHYIFQKWMVEGGKKSERTEGEKVNVIRVNTRIWKRDHSNSSREVTVYIYIEEKVKGWRKEVHFIRLPCFSCNKFICICSPFISRENSPNDGSRVICSSLRLPSTLLKAKKKKKKESGRKIWLLSIQDEEGDLKLWKIHVTLAPSLQCRLYTPISSFPFLSP